MKLAGETLAGRAAILHMDALSHRESAGAVAAPPFAVSPEDFRARAAAAAPLATPALFREIWRGALPGLVSGEFTNRDVFYSSYVQTYIERDGALHPVEIKKSAAPKREMAAAFRMLDPAPQPRGTGAIVCMAGEACAVSSDALVLPAWAI